MINVPLIGPSPVDSTLPKKLDKNSHQESMWHRRCSKYLGGLNHLFALEAKDLRLTRVALA